MRTTRPPTITEIETAAERIALDVVRTPLVRLNADTGDAEIWLKLESLQPIGSFKIRGAANTMRQADADALRTGVVTASAGNMAQGVAWLARQMGVPATVVVPETAPRTKRDAIERLGGRIVEAPLEAWWQAIVDHGYDGVDGFFVHPVSDPAVMAGNGTIGLEIAEALDDIDTVIVPYGGGGLSTGIATAIKARSPRTRVLASEIAAAAPLKPSLEAGERVIVEHGQTFVDGIGSARVLEEMWPIVRHLLDDAIVVSLDETAGAIKLLLERNRVVAEGAAATSVAAAISGRAGSGRIVCVVSGGNIDWTTLVDVIRTVS